jgi:alanyl-tRNA synthetase
MAKEVRHKIKVNLYENFLTDNPDELTAKVISERSLNVREICRAAVGRGGAPSTADAMEHNVTLFLKEMAFQIKGEIHGKFCLIAGIEEKEKCTLMVMLSDQLVADGLNASQIVKEAANHIQGGGGGQPNFATAGGKNATGLNKAIDTVLEMTGLK